MIEIWIILIRSVTLVENEIFFILYNFTFYIIIIQKSINLYISW